MNAEVRQYCTIEPGVNAGFFETDVRVCIVCFRTPVA